MNITQFSEIIEPNDQTEAREENLRRLFELVGNPYPNKFERTSVSGKEDTISNLVEFAPRAEVTKEIAAVVSVLAERERPAPEIKEPLNEKLKKLGNVRVAGRLATPPRVMGKAAFVHLSDGKNRLQIYVRKQDAKAISNDNGAILTDGDTGFALFELLDHGDFIGAEGFLFITNTGELSIHVEQIQFLAKSLLPMPDKMHGIADPELRRRYRYMDLIGSSLQIEHDGLTTREVFERRAKIISSMRRYLEDDGYIEVETPMLTPKATGAAAEPFETHHNALDIKLYARIAPELYLKRLMVGGFEKVYELNRNFRNEGLSHKHSPEFTMLEFYCAYMDVNGMMDLCEEMLAKSVLESTGGLKIEYEGNGIDFSKFERLSMKKAIARIINEILDRTDLRGSDLDNKKTRNAFFIASYLERAKKSQADKANASFYGGIEEHQRTMAEIYAEIEKEAALTFGDALGIVESGNANGITYFEYWQPAWGTLEAKFEVDAATQIVSIFEYWVERSLIQPTFIVDYPKSISPLSKASPQNPAIAERFELFINGMEVANGFSELNDPKEQLLRFNDQMKERESGDAEAMILDEDYIKALSYGMPPTAGIGIGIDRLVMLLTNQHSIRDVILFPHMRPEKNTLEVQSTENES